MPPEAVSPTPEPQRAKAPRTARLSNPHKALAVTLVTAATLPGSTAARAVDAAGRALSDADLGCSRPGRLLVLAEPLASVLPGVKRDSDLAHVLFLLGGHVLDDGIIVVDGYAASAGMLSPNSRAAAKTAREMSRNALSKAFSCLRILRSSAELSLATSVAVFKYPEPLS